MGPIAAASGTSSCPIMPPSGSPADSPDADPGETCAYLVVSEPGGRIEGQAATAAADWSGRGNAGRSAGGGRNGFQLPSACARRSATA